MYLIFGLLIGTIWLAILLILYRHARRDGREAASFLDAIFLWPIVLREFKQNRTTGMGLRITIMLVVLVVGCAVLIQFGTKW